MPTPWQTRRRLIEVCHEAARKGYVSAYEGNFSARNADGSLLITPSRKNKGQLTPDDLVLLDAGGRQRAGQNRPSSELLLHQLIYEARSNVGAVAHAHPPHATAFAVAGLELCTDCMPETYVELGNVPLLPYGTPGTSELPDTLRQAVGSANAFLLAQHGVVCAGADVDEAYYRLEMVEQAARIYFLAQQLGGARRIGAVDLVKLKDDDN